MHSLNVNVNDLRTYKFYHSYALYQNEDRNIHKELLIVVDGHTIYYQVRRFDDIFKETTNLDIAVNTYNEIV